MMRNRIFESILNEAAIDDVNAYKSIKNKTSRQIDAARNLKSRRIANKYSSTIDAGYTQLLVEAEFSDDFIVHFEVYDTADDSLLLNEQYYYSNKTYNSKFIIEDLAKRIFVQIRSEIQEALDNSNSDDFDTVTNAFQKTLSAAQSFHLTRDEVETALFEIFDKYEDDNAYKNRVDSAIDNRNAKVAAARNKAKNSIYDETPDFEEDGYAIWNSKNGPRKVTVISIDEPNNRAKINTDKGATLYVPLDALDKDADYSALN